MYDEVALTDADLLDVLNPAQRKAVCSDAQHLLVLAGAGSGKTRVLVHRIAWLMARSNLTSGRILSVTFTNKAAQEMKRRIESLMGISTQNMWVGTFHGIAHRLLRQHAVLAALPNNFQIMDSDDQLRLIKRLMNEAGFDDEDVEPKRVQGFINRNKDEAKRAHHLGHAVSAEYVVMGEVYRLYEAHCQRSGLVDFAELLLRAYELFQQNPDILAQYQNTFQHILVDEFQDTNTIQYLWLQTLCSPESALTVVGDDDQSIYGWRGAKIENIHRFNRDFGATETIRLEQNYRSSEVILSAANALIQNNESRLGKELWTDLNGGEKITLYGGFNELDEARFIAERMRMSHQAGVPYQDMAVLYRSNAQSRVIEQALRASQIPYKIYGGLRFFDRAEIKDALGYLRLLANMNDDPAFERVINLPPRGIGEKTLVSIREEARAQDISLMSALHAMAPSITSGRISNGMRSFMEIIEHLIETARNKTFPELIKEMFQVSGLLAYIKGQPGERTFAKLENLQELITAAQQFEDAYFEGQESESVRMAEDVLPHFLSEVALDAGDRDSEGDDESVKLMTLHAAKGLEFPYVFLAGLEEGLFPHHRCSQNQELLEEERRLCYVGVTRAMKKLFVTYAEKRTFAGSSGMSRPSRFVKELPQALLEPVHMNATMTRPPSSYSQGFRKTSKPRPQLNDSFPFKMGQQVVHPRFGHGVVTGGEGSGELARVQVNFASEGPKWLVVSFAKLSPA